MRRKTESLLFKFAVIFIGFTVVMIGLSAVITYGNQTTIYLQQCEERLQNISQYLDLLIEAEGDEFIAYQEYMLENYDKVLIPKDFNTYLPEKHEFERLFAEKYPGKTLFKDIQFDELSDDVQLAFAKYKHEYWYLTFEEARSAFDVIYTYYVVPTGQKEHMYYVIDAIRDTIEVDGNEYLLLRLDVD